MTLYVDLSQLIQKPRRSGIQRVERELIRHWPGPDLRPCRFEAGTMQELPGEILDVLCSDAPGGEKAERERLLPLLEQAGRAVPEGATLLCAELFADPARAAFYAGPGGRRAFWLIYDFLPWLHPEWFAAGPATALMPYVRALRSVPNLGFISAATRRDCAERLLRRDCTGPVIALGADGLGIPVQRFAPTRRSFVVLGTIEPRKNAAIAMAAFRHLWAEGVDAELTMIGVVEDDAIEEQSLLRALAGEKRFRHLASLSDGGVRAALGQARALLFPSEGEGYGLPPMEALHAGIPVIAAAGLPAFEGLSEAGQIRLPEVSIGALAAAIRLLLDDATAARLWDEAATLQLPTWRAFAAAVAAWVTGASDPAPTSR